MTDPKARKHPDNSIGQPAHRQGLGTAGVPSKHVGFGKQGKEKKQDTKHYTSTYQKYYIYTTARNTRVAGEEYITNSLQVAFSSFYHYTSTRTEINNEIG